MTDTSTEREIYLLAKDELLKAQSYASDLKLKLKRTEERIEKYKRWMDRYRDLICKSCEGEGKVHEVYAQDDIKLETCKTCNGTGMKR